MVGVSARLDEEFPRESSNDSRLVGAGTMSGFRLMTITEPTSPTVDDRRKPGLERSIKYHRKGFTSARLNETCNVDAHCVFRW